MSYFGSLSTGTATPIFLREGFHIRSTHNTEKCHSYQTRAAQTLNFDIEVGGRELETPALDRFTFSACWCTPAGLSSGLFSKDIP